MEQTSNQPIKVTLKKPVETGDKQDIRDAQGKIKPGHTLNPSGRPKGAKSFTTIMRAALERYAKNAETGEDTEKSNEELLAESIMAKALSGDVTAAKLIWNYLDGMPVQKNVNENSYPQAEKIESALEMIFTKYGNSNTNTKPNS